MIIWNCIPFRNEKNLNIRSFRKQFRPSFSSLKPQWHAQSTNSNDKLIKGMTIKQILICSASELRTKRIEARFISNKKKRCSLGLYKYFSALRGFVDFQGGGGLEFF